MSTVIMGQRGRITIPKDMRDKLGLQPKAMLDVSVHGNTVRILKQSEGTRRVAAIRGIVDLKYAGSVDDYIEEIRGR